MVKLFRQWKLSCADGELGSDMTMLKSAVVHCLLLFVLVSCCVVSAADERPNVVLILADDLGYGDLHSKGHPSSSSPNLDKLVRNSKVMDNFYSAYPWCSPSREVSCLATYFCNLAFDSYERKSLYSKII